MDERKDGRMESRTDGRTDGWMHARTHTQFGRQMETRMFILIKLYEGWTTLLPNFNQAKAESTTQDADFPFIYDRSYRLYQRRVSIGVLMQCLIVVITLIIKCQI